MVPKRIQRKRTKGWRMPDGAVYVGRPTKWGSPYAVGDVVAGRRINSRTEAFDLYNLHTGPMGLYELDEDEVRAALAGKDLACWCALGQPCHADVLLKIANEAVA